MTAPGIELLLRVVADQLTAMRCDHCDQPLSTPRIRLREQSAERMTFEVECRACSRLMLLSVEPEAGEGVIRIR